MIKSNMLKKLSVAFSVLLMAGSLTACGGDEDNNSTACKEGQVNVGGGAGLMAGCYDTCTADANCTGGNVCNSYPGGQKLCTPPKMTSNNPNNNNPMDCEAGKVKANYMGTEQCLVDCSGDASACAATEECTTSGTAQVCTPKAAPTCMEGEVETVFAGSTKQCFKTCTANADCTAANTACKTDDAGVNMICAPESQADMLCRSFCSNFWGDGLKTNCDVGFQTGFSDMEKMALSAEEDACLNGVPAQNIPSCAQRYAQNANSFQDIVQIVVNQGAQGPTTRFLQCTSLEGQIMGLEDNCGCGAEPSLNKPCTADGDCEAGFVQASCDMDEKICGAGACQPALTAAQIQQQIMQQGVAISDGEAAGCGPDTFCFASQQGNGLGSSCLEQCFSNADCAYGVTGDADAGSACSSAIGLGGTDLAGYCLPACATDADCPAQMDANGMMVERICGANRSCQAVCDTAGAACASMRGTCTEGKTAGKLGCQFNYKKPAGN